MLKIYCMASCEYDQLFSSRIFLYIHCVWYDTLDPSSITLFFSYNRLGRDANDADIDEIIDMASKAPLADQQGQVQENIYSQIKNFCTSMDDILHPDLKTTEEPIRSSTEKRSGPRRSGLSLAVGRTASSNISPGEYKWCTY